MIGYVILRTVHVLVAVLGLGAVASALVAARAADGTPRLVGALCRWASWALGAMLVSGVALGATNLAGVHRAAWFRLSFLSLLGAGAALGVARRAAARWGDGRLDAAGARRRVGLASGAALALIGWVTVLMEVRPWA